MVFVGASPWRLSAWARPDSIGIDTWGVDYGLLDAQGELLHAPRAYRDRRMARWAADLDRALPEETAWQETVLIC